MNDHISWELPTNKMRVGLTESTKINKFWKAFLEIGWITQNQSTVDAAL